MHTSERWLHAPLSRRELLVAAVLAPAAAFACGRSEGDRMESGALEPGAASFESDGVRIRYEIAGRGRPLAVLHGWASSYREMFIGNGWLDVLGPIRTIIGVDQRGHGRSDKPHEVEAYEPGPMAGDVVALLDHLDVEKADLFGYSMGGLVTARLLTHHRDRVSAAVLGGVGPNMFDENRTLDALYQPMIEALLADDAADVENEILRNVRIHYEEIGNDPVALAAWMRAGHFAGPPDMLEGLDLPVLVCNAEADSEGAAVAAAIPSAQFDEIPGTNHNSVLSDQRYKDRVRRFFDEIDAA